jgi:hypothetical protein
LWQNQIVSLITFEQRDQSKIWDTVLYIYVSGLWKYKVRWKILSR